jgi:carbon storage regulator
MLYLTRKIGQSVVINDVIEVNVVEIQGRTVKLGFKFPPTEKVLRRELYDRIQEEIHAASGDALNIQNVLTSKVESEKDVT